MSPRPPSRGPSIGQRLTFGFRAKTIHAFGNSLREPGHAGFALGRDDMRRIVPAGIAAPQTVTLGWVGTTHPEGSQRELPKVLIGPHRTRAWILGTCHQLFELVRHAQG